MKLPPKLGPIHFIGIGGIGMSGIAEVMHNLGYTVQGSDAAADNYNVKRLKDLGVRTFVGHVAENVRDAEVVVVSTAIRRDNPELMAAREKRLPVVRRAEMLAELMRMRFGIAIAGTHGKTTTTSLTASILTQAGLDPTFVIGGKLNQVGSNARLGEGRYLVAEADESDASFLHLAPMMSVITNIDMDHMETYQGDFNKLVATYEEFINRLPFYGLAVVCLDDPQIKRRLPELARKTRTYGFDELADVRALDVEEIGLQSRFQVQAKNQAPFEVTLNIPGRHNVQNALAAIAVGLELGVASTAIQQALSSFGGVGRRFEVYPNRIVAGKTVTLVDDYGHHPTELKATLATARSAFQKQRLVLVFQPHRYSRTRDLFDDFVQALMLADLVILTQVYAAGETPLPAFDSKALIQAMRLRGANNAVLVDGFEELQRISADLLQNDDVVLMMGAGDIGLWAKTWQEQGE
jgi:UDP-N-acetylmuramate--alanine ligase